MNLQDRETRDTISLISFCVGFIMLIIIGILTLYSFMVSIIIIPNIIAVLFLIICISLWLYCESNTIEEQNERNEKKDYIQLVIQQNRLTMELTRIDAQLDGAKKVEYVCIQPPPKIVNISLKKSTKPVKRNVRMTYSDRLIERAKPRTVDNPKIFCKFCGNAIRNHNDVCTSCGTIYRNDHNV